MRPKRWAWFVTVLHVQLWLVTKRLPNLSNLSSLPRSTPPKRHFLEKSVWWWLDSSLTPQPPPPPCKNRDKRAHFSPCSDLLTNLCTPVCEKWITIPFCAGCVWWESARLLHSTSLCYSTHASRRCLRCPCPFPSLSDDPAWTQTNYYQTIWFDLWRRTQER